MGVEFEEQIETNSQDRNDPGYFFSFRTLTLFQDGIPYCSLSWQGVLLISNPDLRGKWIPFPQNADLGAEWITVHLVRKSTLDHDQGQQIETNWGEDVFFFCPACLLPLLICVGAE